LTDEMARQAEEIFAEISDMGEGSMLEGCIKGIEDNWFQGRIAESAYNLERSFNQGSRIVVGVNDFTEGNDDADLEILRITNEDERKQVGRLNDVRRDRDEAKVLRALEELTKDALDPEVNLMPALINASRAYVTVGEMMGAMEKVFGRHIEVPTL
jgi:methylmalonyl-CoA mutase N-terminal domain/subunit